MINTWKGFWVHIMCDEGVKYQGVVKRDLGDTLVVMTYDFVVGDPHSEMEFKIDENVRFYRTPEEMHSSYHKIHPLQY